MQHSRLVPSTFATVAGIGLLCVIGAVHLLYAPGYYMFVAYVGALFYATVAGAVVVAIGLVSAARLWSWALGMLLATAAMAGYAVSRTIGLPMFPVLPWQDPFGLAALVAEAAFIALGLIVLLRHAHQSVQVKATLSQPSPPAVSMS